MSIIKDVNIHDSSGDAISASNPLVVRERSVNDTGNSNHHSGLGADEVFTGEWFDTLHYSVVLVSVYADVASATDGLEIQWSSDQTDIHDKDVFTIPADTGKTFSFQPVRRYYRVKYTNGSVGQTHFDLESTIKADYVKPSSHRVADSISGQDDAELVKAVLTGESPTGTHTNVPISSNGELKVSIGEFSRGANVDAFARLRSSAPYTLFDSKQLHGKGVKFWSESTGGSALSTHSPVNASTTMTVTASSSDFAIRQTFQRFNYQPGKSQFALMTFQMSTETGVKKRVGQFSGTGTNYLTPNNGIFFENDEGSLSFNIAKNGSTTETVTQSNWNVDPLDGTGPSGITLDMDAAHILAFDYEWLGVGTVRIGFVIDGLIYYAHYFHHANDPAYTTVYMSTPNNPLRYDIQSDGTGGGSMQHICSMIMSEGGQELIGIPRTINNGTTHVNCNAADTAYACLGLRLKSTHLDISVIPSGLHVMAETQDNFLWRILLNPTVDGTFAYNAVESDSATEYATGTTANTVTGGSEIASGYGSANTDISANLQSAIRLGSAIDGTRDELVLAITPLTSNADILTALNYRELL